MIDVWQEPSDEAQSYSDTKFGWAEIEPKNFSGDGGKSSDKETPGNGMAFPHHLSKLCPGTTDGWYFP